MQTGFEFCPNLFLNHRAYRLTASYLPGEKPQYQLELSETQPELGEVALTGQFFCHLLTADEFIPLKPVPAASLQTPQRPR